MALTADPGSVPGLPESALPAAQLRALPSDVAPAPWTCRARALTWLQRASTPDQEWYGRPTGLSVVSFVEYLDTPVGPYHEVLAAAVLRRGTGLAGQIPFIAVDSAASVLGGRANWALPKTLARFDGELARARIAATGDGWSVAVRPVSSGAGHLRMITGRSVPVRLRFSAVGALGRYRTTLRATSRVVRIRAEVDGPTIGPWLGSGNRIALLSEGRFLIGPPDGRVR